jgi:POT family proton-dependent oligopeptide transporter
MLFTVENILATIAFIAGLLLMLGRKRTTNVRLIGAGMTIIGGGLAYWFFTKAGVENPIAPEIFQVFNPLFIVSLTFVVMGIFAWLNAKGKEPSTPRKIGIGMLIAAAGFVIMVVGSFNLVSPNELQTLNDGGEVIKTMPVPDSSRVLPYWLLSTYLVLTIAELFLSPMGLSFVSKVAPTRFQGVMQGGWLLATAVGNKLLFIGSTFWTKIDLWILWSIFVVCCVLSAAFIFSIMKRLEGATK